MSATGLTGRLAMASERMDRVLDGLKIASPEALDGCAGLLELACQELAGNFGGPTAMAGETAIGDVQALAAATGLRHNIRQARRLLNHAYRFHARWAQLLGARTGGYLRGGQAASVPRANRLCLRG
ncbi:MAG TPA: hypothetical protein VME43_11360 [Bryobacteraceae bacterium]|nr:hypothetical protein [Bryobacteraceae bacterium]